MSIKVRTPARFALAAVLTVATATGALAASRGHGQDARSVAPAPQAWGYAAPGVPSAAWGAYAWEPQGYGYQSFGYSSLSAPDRRDQAKGDID